MSSLSHTSCGVAVDEVRAQIRGSSPLLVPSVELESLGDVGGRHPGCGRSQVSDGGSCDDCWEGKLTRVGSLRYASVKLISLLVEQGRGLGRENRKGTVQSIDCLGRRRFVELSCVSCNRRLIFGSYAVSPDLTFHLPPYKKESRR